MGAPKQKWSSEEEEALRAGIAKHGTGKWKNIQKDPDFNIVLSNRSNIDLKDKWRNMSVSACGQGSREKTKTPKPKAFLPPPSNSVTASPLPLAVQDPSANQDLVLYSSTKNPSVPKNPHRFTTMIIDALESMKDPNGSDADSIMSFIERKYEVNFRNNLGQKLNRLANQDRIEKVHGRSGYFRAKEDGALGALGKKASTSAPKLHDHSQRQSEQTPTAIDSLESEFEEAAKTAAYMIADAENKVFLALKAVEEAERVAKEAAESDSMLQLAIEIFQRCSRGEIVLMA